MQTTVLKDAAVYRELQQHIDKFPIGLPARADGLELKILQHLFSEKEAKLATCLRLVPDPIDKIYSKYQKRAEKPLSREEVGRMLDEMYLKGLIGRTIKDGKKRYQNYVLAIGMFEFQVNRLKKDMMVDFQKYFDETFTDEFFKTHMPQLRVSPVLKDLVQEYKVATYDDVRGFVKNYNGKISVANCVCREGAEVLGNPCKHTKLRETCMTFGFPFYVDASQGRHISREEALGLIDKAEEEGLVLQPSNTKDLFCLCMCCGDCCEVLGGAKSFDRPADYLISNFYAVHNPEVCLDCGTCEEKCQMEAIRKVDGVYQIDLARCIGCGLCVSACANNANKLVQKKELRVPPKDMTDMYLTMLERKAGRRAKILFMLKTLAGQ